MLKHSKFLAYFALVRIIQTLERSDFFILLSKNKLRGMTASELADKLVFKKDLLEPLCEYLVLHVPEIISKRGEHYVLQDGYYNRSVQNNIYFSLAYEEVFLQLGELLRGDLVYGKEVLRDGEMLGISSELYNMPAWQHLCEELQKSKFLQIVDLGCSTGKFLRLIKSVIPRMSCIGVEIDEEVVEVHKESLMTAGVDIVLGDLALPDVWNTQLPDLGKNFEQTAFVCITAIHELLFAGEAYFISVVAKYRKLFPGATLYIVEFDALSYEQLSKTSEGLKNSASVYQLIHPLTLQGNPLGASAWSELLLKSGIKVQKIAHVNPNSVIITCIL